MISSPHFSTTARTNQEGWQDSCEVTAISDPLLIHHEVEQAIWRELHSTPGLHFSSLTVRRVSQGVCLQGVVEVDGDATCPDICKLVKRVAQVDTVVNLLLVCEAPRPVRFVPR